MNEKTAVEMQIAAGEFVTERNYWTAKLAGEWRKASFPCERAMQAAPALSSTRRFRFAAETFQRMRQVCGDSHSKWHMLLAAGVAALAHAYSGETDLVVGTTIDRQDVEADFINTVLPLRCRIQPEAGFRQLLMTMRQTIIEAVEHQNYPVRILPGELNIESADGSFPLFDVAMVLENIQERHFLDGLPLATVFCFDLREDGLHGEILYDVNRQDHATVERLTEHLQLLLGKALENVDLPVGRIDLWLPRDREILAAYNSAQHPAPETRTVIDMFMETVQRYPQRPAVVHGGRTVNYEELAAMVERAAAAVAAHCTGRESFVAVMADRSIELVAALLGTMKAGAAYVPVDPDYPSERQQFMLEDSRAALLLCSPGRTVPDSWNGPVLDPTALPDGRPPVGVPAGNDAAYMIYTSGSSGKPKGVVIEHRSLASYLSWAARQYLRGEELDFPLYSSVSFDLTVTSLYTPLITGNAVVIYDDFHFEAMMADGRVGVIKLTPAHLKLVRNLDWSRLAADVPHWRLKRFIVGGEELESALAAEILERLQGRVEILNEYGPTEATVGCMIHRYDPTVDHGRAVSIGVPADNARIYVLNGNLDPVLPGCCGEICIAGEGLARGYWQRPELTTERFVADPRRPGERLYRSGDLGRWLPEGGVEFLGRIDEQVKIRGFRVEPGEIEAILARFPGMHQVVVIPRDHELGYKYLCAYYTAGQPAAVTELRAFLGKELPEYMIPSYFIHLPEIPLTTNGKVDRRSLPKPDGHIVTGGEYVAPTSEMERILVEVWREVLGVERVGVRDDYFALGGDSIKAIQLVARLQQHDWRVEIRTIFQYPTIEALSLHITREATTISQEPVEGEVELTPIQHWFFERIQHQRQHWNQAVVLHAVNGFHREALTAALERLVLHHDALRMVFPMENGRVRQVNRGPQGPFFTLQVHELSGDWRAELRRRGEELQAGMDLVHGPLLRAGLFLTEAGEYLLLAVHHLVVDGVSWRILLEDLASAYEKVLSAEEAVLPRKTTSFRDWASRLQEYADSKELMKEAVYWKNVTNEAPQPTPDRVWREKDSRRVEIRLTPEESEYLLRDANRAYNTEINDLLLGALGLALRRWQGRDAWWVDLEGHGREELFPGVDLSRTVGWFTAVYPVRLQVEEGEIGAHIKVTKEMLRRVPKKGVGYGVLKYLRADGGGLRGGGRPEIAFNYLGRFDVELDTPWFRVTDLDGGRTFAAEAERLYALDVVGMTWGGEMRFSIGYNEGQYGTDDVEWFAELLRRCLLEIVQHCRSCRESEHTASDFSSSDIDNDEMNAVYQELGIQ